MNAMRRTRSDQEVRGLTPHLEKMPGCVCSPAFVLKTGSTDRVSPGDGILPQSFELCKSCAIQTQKEAFGKYQIFSERYVWDASGRRRMGGSSGYLIALF
jgi:hypothetical protein